MKVNTLLTAFIFLFVSLNAQQILIKNANVFDGKNEQLQEGVDVLIEGNLIKQVAKGIKAPKGAEVIDAHWHSYYAYAPQSVLVVGDMNEVAIHGFIGAEKTLMRGFTTERDVGGNPYAVKKFTDSGEHPGPRLYISGPPISQTSGHFDFRGKNDVPRNSTDLMTYWERNSLIMVADITIFSAENVKDNATYENGTQPSTGIPYVLVNGVIVLKDSKPMPNDVNPGQAIRFEPVAESKLVPLTVDSWNQEFYTVPEDFGGASLRCCDFAGEEGHKH